MVLPLFLITDIPVLICLYFICLVQAHVTPTMREKRCRIAIHVVFCESICNMTFDVFVREMRTALMHSQVSSVLEAKSYAIFLLDWFCMNFYLTRPM